MSLAVIFGIKNEIYRFYLVIYGYVRPYMIIFGYVRSYTVIEGAFLAPQHTLLPVDRIYPYL